MYFKMALRNVKKSFKDYMIYFLTLTFAVCIFYSFNSIVGQQALFEINQHEASYIQLLEQLIGILSVFVAMILGGLILYGNNFLVKKRKKELGIYMTLGMAKGNISKILFLETLIIGIVALGVGLILGIITAQGLSLLTIKLFAFDLKSYTFILSGVAIGKTVLYFSIIFGLVMLFNKGSVSRYKLIDLLNAGKKNETVKMRGKVLSTLLFVGSVVFLLGAYTLIKKIGLNIETVGFWLAIGLGVLGTLFYFLGLTGFLIAVIEGNKKLYFKRLNLFSMRQISSKLHTNVISMTIICLMLFLTIAGLSTGLSFKNTLEKSLERNTPYDATASLYEPSEGINIEESFKQLGITFEGDEKFAIYNEYKLGLRLKDLIDVESDNKNSMSIYGVPISQYNAIRELDGKQPITLADHEVIVTSNNNLYMERAQEIIDQQKEIQIGGQAYTIQNKEVLVVSLETTGFSSNLLTLIVPDQVVAHQSPDASFMNINYGESNRQASEMKFNEFFNAYRQGVYKGKKIKYDEMGFINGYTRERVYKDNQGTTTTILFIGIYLGMVFLISSAAVLALQQLSEASESVERYEVLRKIGVSKKMIHKSIFIQTVVYFLLPLGLALIHAIIGISVANDFISMYNQPDIGMSSMITLVILSVVYGGYWYTTYMGYKNIVDYKL